MAVRLPGPNASPTPEARSRTGDTFENYLPANRSQGSPMRGAAFHTAQAKLCRGDALSWARSTQRGLAVNITAPAK
jgi:hypothetical protein